MSQKVFMLTCGIGCDRESDEITICFDRKTANKKGRKYLEECYFEKVWDREASEVRKELKKMSMNKLQETLYPGCWIEVTQKAVIGSK